MTSTQRVKRTRWKNWATLLTSFLAASVVVAAAVGLTSEPSSAASRKPVALGAAIDGSPWEPAKIDRFSKMIGRRPAVVMWYESWAETGFSAKRMNVVTDRGAMPMVTWEPWNPRQGARQPRYALRNIASGKHDAYIRRWARGAAAWNKPLYLRFAHEMNGSWYPWGANVNGNTRADYKRAWRHVVRIFRQQGATNVRWVWSPNIRYNRVGYASLYPGDAYVNWVALDGYNWGNSGSRRWQSFTQVFGPSYRELTRLTRKPVMIGETASTGTGRRKAAWIRDGLQEDVRSKFPRVRAVVWFNKNKERDWRVHSSRQSLAAYKRVAGSSLYRGRLR